MTNIYEYAQNKLESASITEQQFCGNVSNALVEYAKMPEMHMYSSAFRSFYLHLEYISIFKEWIVPIKSEIMPLLVAHMLCDDFVALSIYCGIIEKEEFDATIPENYISLIHDSDFTSLSQEIVKSWIGQYSTEVDFDTSYCSDLGNLENCVSL